MSSADAVAQPALSYGHLNAEFGSNMPKGMDVKATGYSLVGTSSYNDVHAALTRGCSRNV